MAKSESLGANLDGTETKLHTEGDSLIVQRVQDVTPILDDIKEMRAKAVNPKAVGRIAGRIPNVVYQKWDQEFKKVHGVPMLRADSKTRQKFLASKLNDPDYQDLRIWEGRI